MKTKEDAAKILLERGWTLEDVNRVLVDEHVMLPQIPMPTPCPAPYNPLQPYQPIHTEPWSTGGKPFRTTWTSNIKVWDN